MYEKFTDRARKVIQLANQEAMRFNHEYIGTEHVLLGLVKEGSGVASYALKELGLDLRKIRLEIEKVVQSGPEIVMVGKLPHTPRTKRVIENAIEEARKLNHNYVGTEHILLGLCKEEDTVAANIMDNLIDGGRGSAYQSIFFLLGEDMPLHKSEEISAAQLALENAVADMDFEKASKIRDQIKKDTEIRNKEALRRITCALLGYVKEDYSPKTTLDAIKEVIDSL